MTPAETAAAVKKPISDLGLNFMLLDPSTRTASKALGLSGRQMYYLGRGGALGDVPAEVVAATFSFFVPAVVAEHWDAARQVMPPQAGARAYAGMCSDWGRRNLSGDLDRPLELLERVVDAADAAGLPLFAAWRALPRPDDPPGRLALVMNVMREHRGAVHVAAVAAVGLSPLQAVVAGPYGADSARFFGWPEPYPDPAPLQDRWNAAEDLTAAAAAPPYDVLTATERAELVEGLAVLEIPSGH